MNRLAKIGTMAAIAVVFSLAITTGTAMAQTEDTVETNISGNNVEWSIDTHWDGEASDHFEGEADSATLHQTFTDHDEQWNNFEDIERNLQWQGDGEFVAVGQFNNKAQFYHANVSFGIIGESDDGGSLWERKSATGYAEPTHKAPAKRGAELELEGNYDAMFGAMDMRGDDSGGSDFNFMFDAHGNGESWLNVEEGNVGSEHGSGPWHNEDRYNTNYEFDWDGTLSSQNTQAYGYNSVNFNETVDWGNKHIEGDAFVE